MAKVIGVKFRNVTKVYYFSPGDLALRYDDKVIVETARGLEYGSVVLSPMEIPDEKVPQKPLKDVIRKATEEDTARDAENRLKEKEAYRVCKQKITERGLEMKLIQAEYTFDNSKILFYFTADGRIDFRELVKDLAGVFRTRIELRQIGVRDETKLLGGMGICGRPLCCHTYLGEFAPVSIKMAKEQNLSLNPTKISGCCGRLMCCLKNEADTYAYLNKNLPSKGDQMTTPEGRHGEVLSIDILRQRIRCVVDMDDDEKELQDFHISEITFIPHSKRPKQGNQPKQDKTKKDRNEKTQEPPKRPKPKKITWEEAGLDDSDELPAFIAEAEVEVKQAAPAEKPSRRENRRRDNAKRQQEAKADQASAEAQGTSAENEDTPAKGSSRRRRRSHSNRPRQEEGRPENENAERTEKPARAEKPDKAAREGGENAGEETKSPRSRRRFGDRRRRRPAEGKKEDNSHAESGQS